MKLPGSTLHSVPMSCLQPVTLRATEHGCAYWRGLKHSMISSHRACCNRFVGRLAAVTGDEPRPCIALAILPTTVTWQGVPIRISFKVLRQTVPHDSQSIRRGRDHGE